MSQLSLFNSITENIPVQKVLYISSSKTFNRIIMLNWQKNKRSLLLVTNGNPTFYLATFGQQQDVVTNITWDNLWDWLKNSFFVTRHDSRDSILDILWFSVYVWRIVMKKSSQISTSVSRKKNTLISSAVLSTIPNTFMASNVTVSHFRICKWSSRSEGQAS